MYVIPCLRRSLSRRPGVAVLAVALFCVGIGLADRFPTDPVEDLRLALRLRNADRNLVQRVQALRTLAEMRRALGLREWGTAGAEEAPAAQRHAHSLSAAHFKKEGRQGLKHAAIDGRLA